MEEREENKCILFFFNGNKAKNTCTLSTFSNKVHIHIYSYISNMQKTFYYCYDNTKKSTNTIAS